MNSKTYSDKPSVHRQKLVCGFRGTPVYQNRGGPIGEPLRYFFTFLVHHKKPSYAHFDVHVAFNLVQYTRALFVDFRNE